MRYSPLFAQQRGLLSVRSAVIVAALIASAGILAAGSALRPAVAAGSAIEIHPDALVTCSSGGACEVYDNRSSGQAFEGETNHGTGLYGVAGTSGTGVFGNSSSGYGMLGESTSGTAILGETNTDSNGLAGVSGVSAGTSGHDYGVAGTSSNGAGVHGESSSSNGVYGQSTATGGNGVEGQELGTSSGNGNGVWAESADTTGIYNALYAQADNSQTYIFDGFNSATDKSCLINAGADLICDGMITGSVVRPQHMTAAGQRVLTYAAETASATLEDVGTARMTDGVANVGIDAAFASTIDRSTPYYLFLTPLGDTRGLYVSLKSASGFQVREAQGGHSTLSFDYRIVARPLDAKHDRLPLAPATKKGSR
jgi:hypothetical protein